MGTAIGFIFASEEICHHLHRNEFREQYDVDMRCSAHSVRLGHLHPPGEADGSSH